MDDPAVAQPEDGHLIHPLEAAAGRSMAQPRSQVGGGAGEAAHHLVTLADQLHDLHADIREAGPERRDPAPRGRGKLGRVQLVDHLQPAAVEDLLDQPPDGRLVVLDHRMLLAMDGSAWAWGT